MSEQEPTASEEKAPETPETPRISIDDFKKIELKVGKVIEAALVEGADRLLVMQVELGEETRQVVSGIRADYSPEDMVGKNVILVANLKPATIRGVRSQGMLLAAHDADGIVVAEFGRDLKSGSPVT